MQQSLHRRAASARGLSSPGAHVASLSPRISRKASLRHPGRVNAFESEMGIVAQGREWLNTILSRFGPMRDRAQVVTTLDFEKPLLELDKRIKEVRASAFPSFCIHVSRSLRWAAHFTHASLICIW
eukprot:1149012-Pelagomonas_calceolata.AAC.3